MKNILRQKLLNERKQLGEKELLEKSSKIESKLFSMPEFKTAKTVMFYVSFNTEVFTHNMIREALKEKKVIVPKVREKQIVLYEINNFEEIDQKDKFGILQPSKGRMAKKEEIGLIIVPGVGFDKNGHRLGYGYGYYDRFLENLKIPTIGLAFDFQIVDKLPAYGHDVKMGKVITEKRILEFG